MDRLSLWNLLQVIKRYFVFRLDPGAAVGRVRIFQPTIRIGDYRSMVVVHLVDLFCHRVLDFGLVGSAYHQHQTGNQRNCKKRIRSMRALKGTLMEMGLGY